ncbi:MAG: hypothetical protein FMNOHCHN_01956 [Ignavibacteriaceae bacterium]|nr:hypothetical protein [Ignavibacteriaceae bacterium]
MQRHAAACLCKAIYNVGFKNKDNKDSKDINDHWLICVHRCLKLCVTLLFLFYFCVKTSSAEFLLEQKHFDNLSGISRTKKAEIYSAGEISSAELRFMITRVLLTKIYRINPFSKRIVYNKHCN